MILRKPEMFQVMLDITSAEHVKDATGAVMCGTNSSRWDARFFDTVKLIQIQSLRIEKAHSDAMERQ